MRLLSIITTIFLTACGHMDHGQSQSVTAAQGGVNFVNVKDGDTIAQKFKVQFGLTGMELKPAGDATPNSGHHHLIIDGKALPKGTVVPKDDKNLHYGKAQTEAEITLKPGKHTLTMQFADKDHVSYGEEWSKTITVNVK